MKRLLSAAAAAALILTAVSPALAGDISKGTRPVKATTTARQGNAHAFAGGVVALPGKKHFGMTVTTKKQLAVQHHFAAAAVPNLSGQKKP